MPSGAMGILMRRSLAIWLSLSLSLACGSATPRENSAVAELLTSARMWNAKHRNDLAHNALEKALQVEPDNPRVLLELGLLDIKINATAQAKEWLNKLEKLHPGAPATRQLREAYRIASTDRFRMGAVRTLVSRLTEKDRNEAVAKLRELFPDGPPEGELGLVYYGIMDAASRAHYGIIDANEKIQAEARAGLEHLATQMPGDPRPLMALAEHYFGSSATRMKGIKMAEELAKRSDVDQQEAMGLWRNGLSHLGIDPDNIPLYQDFLRHSPTDETISKLLAQASDPQLLARKLAEKQLADDNQSGAENLLETLARQHPNDGKIIGALGQVRLRQGRHEEAGELFQQAAKLDASDAKRWGDLQTDAKVAGIMREVDKALAEGRVEEVESKIFNAVRLRPNNPDIAAAWAETFALRQDTARAESMFREVLAADPTNYRAVRGLAEMMAKTGQSREARRFVEDIIQAYPGKTAGLNDVAANMAREEASRLLSENRGDSALSLLEDTHRRYPGAAWLRYDLARYYVRQGDIERGRQLMEQNPGEAADTYAQAVFLAGLDDEPAALAALERVPEAERNASIQTLSRQLSIRQRGKQALEALHDSRDAARQMLSEAEAMAGDDPELRWETATAWLRIGETKHGLELGQQLLKAQPEQLETRLRYAGLLNEAKRDKELAGWLESIPDNATMTNTQRQTLQDLRRANTQRTAQTLREKKNFAEARQILSSALAKAPKDPGLLTALGELHEEDGDKASAEQLYQQAIATQPDYYDARIAQAKLWWESGHQSRATAELERLRKEVPATNVDARLSLIRRYTAQKNYNDARDLLTGVQQRRPNDPEVLMQAGRTEQAAENHDAAMALFTQAKALEKPRPAAMDENGEPLRTAATEAVDDLLLRRNGYFNAGWDQRSKVGDPGTSLITNDEYPMYLRVADGYRGHWFSHVDYSIMNAGNLPLYDYDSAALFGQIQARGANTLKGESRQVVTGTAFGAGYESDDWRFDLGSSPRGFPVEYLVGGIKNTGSLDKLFWAVDLARRPIPNSLTSYAGATDPVTGAVWGGVKKTGSEIYLGYDWGPLTLFTQGVYHYLDGKNVKSNQEIMVRTGFDLALFTRPNMRFSAGVALMHWQFDENQRYYTFGHGGYYSPQDYKSVSLPVQWSGRVGKLSYQARGAVSWAASYEDAVNFYPTSAELQTAATTAPLPNDFSKPVYDGGYGASFGYSAAATVEYQATPNLALGGHWQMQRSPYYTPDYLGAYFRYTFEERHEKSPFPPKGLKPYYDF